MLTAKEKERQRIWRSTHRENRKKSSKQYYYKNINFDLINSRNYQYVKLPNVKNSCDNNLFIIKS